MHEYILVCCTVDMVQVQAILLNGVPANQIRKTSPVSCMNDAQWCALVHMWLSSKNQVCVCVCVNSFISCLVFMWSTCVAV